MSEHTDMEAVVEAMGISLPTEEVLSTDLEERLSSVYDRCHLSAGRLELMTGIRARRFWREPRVPSDISSEAGEALLARSGADRAGVDGVIHAAVCRDRLEPATAAYVHHRLGLKPEAFFFDLSNACLGFVQALDLARTLIRAGSCRRVMVVAGEDGLPLIEHTLRVMNEGEWNRKTIKPFFANLTIGSGGVAALVHGVPREQLTEGIRLGPSVLRADSSASHLCQGGSAGDNGLQMQTDSEGLLEAGIALAGKTWEEFLKVTGSVMTDFDAYIPHQVGRSHEKMLGETLGYPMERALLTYPFLGNVGSVSLPITLALGLISGQVVPGNRIAMMGIGSGLSCQMMEAEVLGSGPVVGIAGIPTGDAPKPVWGTR